MFLKYSLSPVPCWHLSNRSQGLAVQHFHRFSAETYHSANDRVDHKYRKPSWVPWWKELCLSLSLRSCLCCVFLRIYSVSIPLCQCTRSIVELLQHEIAVESSTLASQCPLPHVALCPSTTNNFSVNTWALNIPMSSGLGRPLLHPPCLFCVRETAKVQANVHIRMSSCRRKVYRYSSRPSRYAVR